jgi:hypothetical protein
VLVYPLLGVPPVEHAQRHAEQRIDQHGAAG